MDFGDVNYDYGLFILEIFKQYGYIVECKRDKIGCVFRYKRLYYVWEGLFVLEFGWNFIEWRFRRCFVIVEECDRVRVVVLKFES